MLMLTQCSGGKERSLSQLEALASASGFHKCEIVGLAYTYSVIEFHKKIQSTKISNNLISWEEIMK